MKELEAGKSWSYLYLVQPKWRAPGSQRGLVPQIKKQLISVPVLVSGLHIGLHRQAHPQTCMHPLSLPNLSPLSHFLLENKQQVISVHYIGSRAEVMSQQIKEFDSQGSHARKTSNSHRTGLPSDLHICMCGACLCILRYT